MDILGLNLELEFTNNDITLLIIKKEDYRIKIVDVARANSKIVDKVCYMCLNTPYSYVLNNLSKNDIPVEKFFFIDSLTKSNREVPKVSNCIFLSAPNALTELSIALSQALDKEKCESVVFDTISTLQVYEKASTIIELVHDILTKLRTRTGKATFIVLKEDSDSELIKDMHMFVDKVIDLSTE